MKLSITAIVASIILFAFTSDKPKTDWEQLKIKGKVKAYTETRFEARDSAGTITKGRNLNKTISSFNVNGNYIDERYYQYESTSYEY